MPGKGRPFQKGKPGGPGRPRMNPELKKIPGLSKEEVDKILAKFGRMSRAEIKDHMADPATPMLELMVGAVVMKAYQHGDQSRLNFILERTIGKVKDQVEVTLPEPTFVKRLNGEVIELGAEMIGDGKDD